MAVAVSLVVAVQGMILVLRRELHALAQKVDGVEKFLHVASSLLEALVVLLEA